jgi:hypothetical protein
MKKETQPQDPTGGACGQNDATAPAAAPVRAKVSTTVATPDSNETRKTFKKKK